MRNFVKVYLALIIIFLLGSTFSSPIYAQSTLIDWNPAWNNDWGAAKQPARIPITSWLNLQTDSDGDTVLMRDGKEFVVIGTGVNNASVAIGANSYMTDADMKATINRIVALGHNTLRMQGWCTKNWSGGSASNYGCWLGATGTAMSETFLAAMDREIAYANQKGLQIWLGGFYTGRYLARARPDLPVVSCDYYGMQWSDVYKQYAKEYISIFANRINTVTGVRWIDNPGIIWQPENENGFSYGYFSSSKADCMDGMISDSEATNPWTRELNTKIRNYYTTKGWALPGNRFPLKTTYNTWGSTDKLHFMTFMNDTDVEYARQMYEWFNSKNSRVIVNMGTFNYMSGQVLNFTDLVSHHVYASAMSGDAITNPPNYQTRTSTLKDNNGFDWSWAMGGSRLRNTPYIQTETGDRALNRWDFERYITEAVIQNLQKTSGIVVFNESQALSQAKATGIQYNHHHPGWPSRQLSVLLSAPILEHRMISPLPNKYIGVYNNAEYLNRAVVRGKVALSPWFFVPSIGDGSERGYWAGRIYMGFGEGTDTDTYPKVTDAQFAAGFRVPTVTGEEIFASTNSVTVNTPYVAGLVNGLKNSTIGPLTISGATPMENAVVMIRSDAKYPLFTGPAKLFVHSHSLNTDAPGFSLTTDGATVTGWGTQINTRLVVPNPFSITLASGRDLNVLGVNDDGTTVAIPTNFNGANVSFLTQTRFPLYLVTPKGMPPGSTPTPASKPGDLNGDGAVNMLDYVILSISYGTNDSNSDLNQDGIVNSQDYIILKQNFGT